MNNKILLLRICYWTGAIADGLNVIPMLYPRLFLIGFGISDFNLGIGYKYALWLGVPLMLGWTFLLIWADRKPVERKGIILLTVFPILFGIIIAEIVIVASNFIAMERMIPFWIFQITLASLYIFSYLNTRGIRQK